MHGNSTALPHASYGEFLLLRRMTDSTKEKESILLMMISLPTSHHFVTFSSRSTLKIQANL